MRTDSLGRNFHLQAHWQHGRTGATLNREPARVSGCHALKRDDFTETQYSCTVTHTAGRA